MKLSDLCDIKMGQSPESSTYNEDGNGLPFFQGNADFGKIHPSVRVWCSAPVKIAFPNDILISVRAPIGAMNIADCECCIGRGLAAITVNDSICNAKYVWYALQSKVNELNAKGTGSTFKAINKATLADTEIPYVSLERQQKIADILDKVSLAIDKRIQQIALFDLLVKSRFVEMFGEPILNPLNWDKVPLGELSEIKIGPFGTLLHKEDYIEGGHALVNPSHIVDGKIVVDMKLTVSDEKYAELSAYHLLLDDVVLGRRGEMGRCAVVSEEGLLCGTGSLIIRTNGRLKADFIQKIISFPSFKKIIENKAVGQTMSNLNVPIVSNFLIICPPIDVQERYYSFVAQTDKSKYAVKKSLEKLETLKKALMQEYFG